MPKATRSWGRSIIRYAPYAAKGLMRGVSTGMKAYGAMNAVKRYVRGNNKRSVSGQGVTNQRDRSTIYRRRRAPRRLRTKQRRAMRSFKSKILKLKGNRTMLTNSSVTVTSLSGEQSVKSFVLYGGKRSGVADTGAQRGYDDMNDLRSRDYMLGDNTGDAEQRFAPGEVKWYVKTAIMDMTLQNSTANTPLELDIYEFYCGIIPKEAGADVESAIDFYQQDVYKPGPLSLAQVTLTQKQRGVTPFEFGSAMSKFRMKIIKKTKYFIPPGDTITYQIRDTKIRTVTHDVFRNDSATTRHTHGLYIVAKPTIQQAVSEGQYIIGVTRKYKYVVDSSATTRAAYWDPAAL